MLEIDCVLSKYVNLSVNLTPPKYYFVHNKPCFENFGSNWFGEDPKAIAAKIKRYKQKFMSVALDANRSSPSDVQEIIKELDGKYKIVRPDDLIKFAGYHERGIAA